MKKSIALAILTIALAATASADFGTWDNAYRAISGGEIEIRAVATDALGNSYLTGRYAGSVRCGALTRTVTSNGQNLFHAKLGADGNCLWLTTGGVYTNPLERMGIAVDPNGDVVVTGPFTALATFGTFGLQSDFPGTDMFIAKLRGSDGAFLWARDTFNGDAATGADAANLVYGTDVAVASNGLIYVTGTLVNTARFKVTQADGITNSVSLDVATRVGIVTATTGTNTLAGSGTLFLEQVRLGDVIRLSDGQTRTVTAIASDTSLTVNTNWTATATNVFWSIDGLGFGHFIARVTPDGRVNFVRSIQTNTSLAIDRTSTIAVGQKNVMGVITEEIFVSAQFTRTARFGGIMPLTALGETDILVAKLDSTFFYEWTARGGGAGSSLNFNLAADALGNAYVSSFAIDLTPQTISYGPHSLTYSVNNRAGVLARIDRTGTWTGLVAVDGGSFVRALVTPSGEPYLIKPEFQSTNPNLLESIKAADPAPAGGPIPPNPTVIKLDRDLRLVWLKPVENLSIGIRYGAAISPNLDVTLATSFNNPFSVRCDQPCATTEFTVRRDDTDSDGAVLRVSDGFVIGRQVNRPAGAIEEGPAIEITQAPNGTDNSNSYFFSPFNKHLYAVRPARTRLEWRVSNDPLVTERIVRRGRNIWPFGEQRHITQVPVELQPPGINFTFSQVLFTETNASVDGTKTYTNTQPGRDVLLYLQGLSGDITAAEPELLVVRSFVWNDPAVLTDGQPCTIGNQLLGGAFHNDPQGKTGYVFFPRSFYDGAGPNRAHDRAARRGPIIPVNLDTPAADDDMVVVYFQGNFMNVSWPVNPLRYNCQWPSGPFFEQIVIASQLGSDVYNQPRLDPAVFKAMEIYHQPDRLLPGYNPNEEHALFAPSRVPGREGLNAIFALRSDLNAGSLPFTLLKYRNGKATPDPADDEWAIFVYRVLDRNADYPGFSYSAIAGNRIEPPYPLSNLAPCTQTFAEGTPYFQDYKGGSWARSQGSMIVRYFYPLQINFDYDINGDRIQDKPLLDCVPWLDRLPGGTPGTPTDVTYNVTWPAAPTLRIGETLIKAKNGLPSIATQAAAEIIFDQIDPDETNPNLNMAQLIDALSPVSVPLAALPSGIATRSEAGLRVFEDAPPAIKRRLRYDPVNARLIFQGLLDESGAGDPLLLLNVMTSRERDRIKTLTTDGTFGNAVDALYHKTRNPRGLDLGPVRDGNADQALLIGLQDANNDGIAEPFRTLGVPGALTAGKPQGTGFLTLAFNNHPSLNPLPVSLSVIQVGCPVYQGQIQIIESDNVFDEKITLRHSGDFGGDPDQLVFTWLRAPDVSGISPVLSQFLPHAGGTPLTGTGLIDITIEGANRVTISDNWFISQYTGYNFCDNATIPSPPAGAPGASPAAPGQLAVGWIKRVTTGLNPFEARVRDFHKAPANTIASLISQVGERYEGDIAFSGDPANLNTIGLIAAYETVMRRGFALSIDASPPDFEYEPANAALLNVASRISDFYMLLGNEAFGDGSDPTIGFGTQSGVYGTLAPTIFNFQNQLDSILDEELVLLRGRDDANAPVRARPVYNRLFWNFTSGDGELAYSQSYNVSDQNFDGFLNEFDARIMFPQGHGDAWGHYLSATKLFYGLLRHPVYGWKPRAEGVLVAGVPIQVDFLDERKLAKAAAAKAKAGAEIVDLTYRANYVEDPAGQFTGYKDTNTDRAWGVVDWARRAGQGAYFDWVLTNSIVPDVDPEACAVLGLSPGSTIPSSAPPELCHSGITRIDRTTVRELIEIASEAAVIQGNLDEADQGLNPLGAAKGVVSFDIDPALVTSTSPSGSKTHFEQIYDRALASLRNTLTVFDNVNQLGLSLRRNQDTLTSFTLNVQQRERDLNNRLIEVFGYPYPEDIGPTGTYPLGYQGPDIYHYMYIDPSELTGTRAPETAKFKAYYTAAPGIGHYLGDPAADPFKEGGSGAIVKEVEYEFALSGGLGLVKPSTWVGRRRAPGELQLALSELYQNRALFEKASTEYDNLIKMIEGKAGDIAMKGNLNANIINILNSQSNQVELLDRLILTQKATALTFKRIGEVTKILIEAKKESLPKVVGLANDATSGIRGALLGLSAISIQKLETGADLAELAQSAAEVGKDAIGRSTDISVMRLEGQFDVNNLFSELEDLIRKEPVLRLEAFVRKENVEQSISKYLGKLAKAERTLDELVAFRRNTAAQVQQYRYEDLTFRVFRNDALQKYRAQFDLAARYAYLAATAYDFETNLLGTQSGSGREFLTNIVRQRAIGQVIGGQPVAGSNGLADPLARMSQNFAVIKGQLGFNNPQTETNRFSLRAENERLRDSSNDQWRAKLAGYRVANLNDIPEFRRYCRPFAPDNAGPQPALVIPFSTTVTFGQNFFGRPLGGGDSAYDPTHFATKVRSVGVWFGNYNGTGLSNTPRVYLVPAGSDFLRSPSGNLAVREFSIIDQKIPTPFPIGASDLTNPAFIPLHNGLSDEFGDIRKFSSFRAFHDSGSFTPAETVSDTRLIGRSVWNDRWLLIIPGGTLLANANEGLDTFIYGKLNGGVRDGNGINDIKIFFQTYAYSGN